jgi:acetyltransferase-like isoleucine patch superfamily enzyme
LEQSSKHELKNKLIKEYIIVKIFNIIKYSNISETKEFQFLKTLIKSLKEKRRKPITGLRNTINNLGLFYKVKYDIIGNDNLIYSEKKSLLTNAIVSIRGNNNRLIIKSGVRYKGGYIRFEGDNCLISLGEDTVVAGAALQVVESDRKIIIGQDCMFSIGIHVWTSDFHSIVDLSTGHRINESKDVLIGNHVWVGEGSLILKGATLEDGSIVAARSVVTGNVPKNTIVGGCPAKIIKQNVDWKRSL